MGRRMRMSSSLRLWRLRWRRLLRLSRNFDDETMGVLLPCFLVNVLDMPDARLLKGEPPPADGASEVLLTRVRQLMPLKHPPEVEPFITEVADELLGCFVFAASALLLLLLRSAEVGSSCLVFAVTRVSLKESREDLRQIL